MFYFSTISWLRLSRKQSEYTWTLKEDTLLLHIKVTLPPMIFDKPLAFNLRKKKVTNFSFTSLTINFCCALEKLKFKLLLPGIVSFSTIYLFHLPSDPPTQACCPVENFALCLCQPFIATLLFDPSMWLFLLSWSRIYQMLVVPSGNSRLVTWIILNSLILRLSRIIL